VSGGPDARNVSALASMPARRISAAAASIASSLQQTAPLQMVLQDATCSLTWTALSEPPFTTVLCVRIGGHEFDVLLDDIGIVPELAPQVMRTLAEPARLVAATFVLEPLLEVLQNATSRAVALEAVSYRRTEQLPAPCVGFLLEDGTSRVIRRGCIVPRDGLAWELLDTLSRGLPPMHPPECDAATGVRLVLGSTRLALSQLEALAAGWLILVEVLAAGARGFALVTGRGEVCGRFRIERGGCLARSVDMGEGQSVKVSVIEGTDRSEGRIDDIELGLEFDLGGAIVSLEALRAFTPGQVLELDRPIEACRIGIRCGNRTIGTGELVELDGQLGVRILTIDRRG